MQAFDDAIKKADGPALLVSGTELLRLQESVNELNDFLNRQSQMLIALTKREADLEASSKASGLLPLQNSPIHPSKVSALPTAPNSRSVEVVAIGSLQFL